MVTTPRTSTDPMLPACLVAVSLGAGLLFLVQPLVGKTMLPLLGGSPAVWNTCMVFFQTVLLAGYLYAHLVARMRSRMRQVWVHTAVLLASMALLPVGLPAAWSSPPPGRSPIGWLLVALAVSVGGPFFVLSSATPLLQSWFARSRSRSAGDPYFLYAASNAGSVLALLGYPFLLEPSLGLHGQRWLWSVGYGIFAATVVACGLLARKRTAEEPALESAGRSSPLDWRTRLRWIFFAFVPSSLMLGVTQHLSTDISSLPLLWVMPLTLYLISFIVVFWRGGQRASRPAALLLPALAVLVALQLMMPLRARGPIELQFALHLLTLLAAALVCHGRLAAERPRPFRLTEFYLLIATGGALGGVFNALVAPVAFDWIAEYPIALVLACLIRSGSPEGAPTRWVTVRGRRWFRIGFASALGVLLLLPRLVQPADLHLVHTERTFFGVHRVLQQPAGEGNWRYLWHGSTRHGAQFDTGSLALKPTTYYAPSGPIGDIMRGLAARGEAGEMAFVGLGAGTLAAYGHPDWRFTFYEIDPAVVRIANDARFFTYLRDSRSPIDLVQGDARLALSSATDGRFDLIVLDAFSSDSIPTHLITREAVSLYVDKLAADGILAFHISNLHLDLSPVLARVAADLDLSALDWEDVDRTETQRLEQKNASRWVVLARTRKALRAIARDRRWDSLEPTLHGRVWTDDYSNVLGALSSSSSKGHLSRDLCA